MIKSFAFKKLLSFTYFFIFLLFPFTYLNALGIEGNTIEDQLNLVDYYFCVDGGGSKTALQVLDSEGKPLLLTQSDGTESYLFQGDCSNVVSAGKEKVQAVLSGMLDGLKVGPKKHSMAEVIPKSSFIGGFAGVGLPESTQAMLDIVISLGFLPEKIMIYTDAGLALELVGDNGAIMISGTGSICFIRENQDWKRIGGLGYRIGDNGSGYSMGLSAIKAAIEEEYSYGLQTSLTPLIKELFNVGSALDLIGTINSNQESPGKIASVAPLVFQEAWKGDPVAYRIVKVAADELGELLANGVKQTELRHCLTYLIGGLFQNEKANTFIQMICQSPAMQALGKGSRPLLVNMSANMIPSLVIQEKLKIAKGTSFKKLASLPIVDDVMREDYKVLYNNEFLTSVLPHQTTPELSQTFYQDRLEGLKLLQSLDYSVLGRAEEFLDKYFEKMTQTLTRRMKAGGRVIFVGRGSSGRLSVDLAAKWNEFWKTQNSPEAAIYAESVQAVISGGAKAFVLPKKECRDLQSLGYKSLKDLNISSKDTVIIISASGTPQFHIGAGKAASDANATCYYFSHTEDVADDTRQLFSQYSVEPLCIDVGAQTITGSNRLQSASLSEFTWGVVLSEVLHDLLGESKKGGLERAFAQLNNLRGTWDNVASQLSDIKKVVDLQIGVFSDKDANFWRSIDKTYHGYITFLASEDCLRDIMIDIAEASPTFSSTRLRATKEAGMKKAEYRAYMLGEYSNRTCWNKMIARDVRPDEQNTISDFLLSMREQGYGDYICRTISNKNLLIGALSSSLEEKKALELCMELIKAKDRGLKTVMIVVEEEGAPLNPSLLTYLDQNDVCIRIPEIPKDRLHLMKTLALKQVLNLISNGAMIGMNKVYGNVLIDIASLNDEVIDRAIRIVQGIYTDHHPDKPPFEYELLYHMVARATKYQQLAQTQWDKHIPSPVKVVLTMLEKDCEVEKAVSKLKINNENIQLILNEI